MILQPAPITEPPVPERARHIAILESLLANPKLNDGRRAWAKAELKRLKEKWHG